MLQTGSKQYMDEAYAWEVATVRVCFHVLFSSFAMPVFVFHQSTTRLVGGFLALSLLTSPALFSPTALRCFALHFRNAGPSRRRVEQANLYGLCFAVSPEPNCEPRPHICETYQSIGRIEEARQQLGAAALSCLGFSK